MMRKSPWERPQEAMRSSQPGEITTQDHEQGLQPESAILLPGERRVRMLREAERQGLLIEAITMLGLVRSVEGFTNWEAVFSPPSRSMIDSEHIRGARDERQARGRAWKHQRERWVKLDMEMRDAIGVQAVAERQEEVRYYRPSDWVRLFAAFKKATKTGEGVPHVFATRSATDRAAFRKWAEQFGLNGDGLVHAVQAIDTMYEEQTGRRLDYADAIQKIQRMTAEKLDMIIRAGFTEQDLMIGMASQGYGEGYIPASKLHDRLDLVRAREREQAIEQAADKLPLSTVQGQSDRVAHDMRYRQAEQAYDTWHFGAIYPDRNSMAFENGIIGGVFASVENKGDIQAGFGYHGIIEPELDKMLPPGTIVEERGKARARHDGKIVVTVQRWLVNKEGPRLFERDEVVKSEDAGSLGEATRQKIADAIVYGIHDPVQQWVAHSEHIQEPYYWKDTHWEYKNLTEDRLPFLARVAKVNTNLIEKFVGDEAEKEWMHSRIMSSGVTAVKQLDEMESHFEIKLEDVYPAGPERTALQEAATQYPENITLGSHSFGVAYEWSEDGQYVERAVIEIIAGAYGNSFYLRHALPSDIPDLGIPGHPAQIIFKYEERHEFFPKKEEFLASRFRDLLELIEPKEEMIRDRWHDFERTEDGQMKIPLKITTADRFPTPEQTAILLQPHRESVVFMQDRDGVEHRAYTTIRHEQGDDYVLCYVQDQERAGQILEASRKTHAERQAASQQRASLGEALNTRLVEVRRLQTTMDGYMREYAQDNLVAFVLGREPFTADDQRSLETALDKNDFRYAELMLNNSIHDRTDRQEIIDNMRAVADLIRQLEALGFDWQRYRINQRSQRDEMDFDRPDREGFYRGDIRVHNHEIYHPSMGRVIYRRPDYWRLRDELPRLQQQLEQELERWQRQKEELKEGRARQREADATDDEGPEIVRRGGDGESESESEGGDEYPEK